jgi:CheY-like chemotaxis protein
VDLAPDAGNVRADTVQLEQVVVNLAVNARDAMPRGGRLCLSTRALTLHQELDELPLPVPPGQYVVLSVSDTGDGMPPAIMSRIFEPFFTTKEKGHGTGLGLSTVYGIVRQSDGHIGLDSTVGKGTTFRVYLPRVEVLAEPEKPLTQTPVSLAGKETILLAEDEGQLRKLYTALLRKMGYQVLETANAKEALEVAVDYRGAIDLLITDVVMPEISGPELARLLEESGTKVPVLYISGYTSDAIVRHGLLRPGVNYLQKPFAPIDFARRVRQLLDARPARLP